LLILTRQPQKSFCLSHPDGRITIRVLNISGPSVRLAIDAPRSVEILRDDAHLKTDSPTPETKEPHHDR
jgi:carbon storage regulator CsrA